MEILDNVIDLKNNMGITNAETTTDFQRLSNIPEMAETKLTSLKLKPHSVNYLNFKNEIKEVSNSAPDIFCVSEDTRNVILLENKYLDISNVTASHIVNMSADDNNDTRITDNHLICEEQSTKNKRASCVCKCHCRRNYQRNGLTRKSRLKSAKYSRHFSDDKLSYLSQRQKNTIGLIRVNKTSKDFRTRLKNSEECKGQSELGISESNKGYINSVCLYIKRNMAKLLCHCVILLLLCLCGVAMVHHNHGRTNTKLIHNTGEHKHKHNNYISTKESSILLDIPFRSVSKDDFEKHLAKSKSAADMLKIFFNDSSLTDEQVNSIMYMKHKYGSTSIDTGVMRDAEYNNREIAYEHYLEFERSHLADCSEPKPEVVRIEDTYSDSIRYYLPSCTVVHRCSNKTACCPRGYVCAPKKENGIEVIDKFFLVLEKDPVTNELKPAKDLVAAKAVINHTACECQKIDVNTNCRKECPQQFVKRRPGANCECRCTSGHKKCHKIHKGLLPLDEKDLECIKEERCIVPKCHSGKFSIFTGFCPHFRRQRG